ncbi:uncharacterized protein, partial [Diadema antillarum]
MGCGNSKGSTAVQNTSTPAPTNSNNHSTIPEQHVKVLNNTDKTVVSTTEADSNKHIVEENQKECTESREKVETPADGEEKKDAEKPAPAEDTAAISEERKDEDSTGVSPQQTSEPVEEATPPTEEVSPAQEEPQAAESAPAESAPAEAAAQEASADAPSVVGETPGEEPSAPQVVDSDEREEERHLD